MLVVEIFGLRSSDVFEIFEYWCQALSSLVMLPGITCSSIRTALTKHAAEVDTEFHYLELIDLMLFCHNRHIELTMYQNTETPVLKGTPAMEFLGTLFGIPEVLIWCLGMLSAHGLISYQQTSHGISTIGCQLSRQMTLACHKDSKKFKQLRRQRRMPPWKLLKRLLAPVLLSPVWTMSSVSLREVAISSV